MRHVLALFFALLLALQAPAVGATPLKIAYSLSPQPPKAGMPAVTHVSIHLSGLTGQTSIQLQMPVWSPGDYHVQNHGKYVQDFRATTPKDKALAVTRPDQNTWQVKTGGEDVVEVTYSLPNTPRGFFTENVDVREKHAFYNGPATFMYVVGHKQDPVTLHVTLPAAWGRVAVPLEPVDRLGGETGHNHSENSADYTAHDYDILADSPIVVGDLATREFQIAGIPHRLVFFGPHAGVDYDSFVPVVRKIVEEQLRLMGGAPYQRYYFFIEVNGRGGALEHLNAQRIPWAKGSPVRFMAGGFSHEFFHLWNVKRIRPLVLGPFDYVDPPRTRNLWFSEGVTSYYGDLSVRRAGLATDADYLSGLAAKIRWLQATPGRKRVTADESSLRVWEANNSNGYGGLSYYLKGELIGLCLDLKLRGLTNNRSSLDGVMRDMMARFGLPKPGFPEDGIRDAVIRAGGAEMGPFYDLLCRSTEELPFAECLSYAGLLLETTGRNQFVISPAPDALPQAVAVRRSWLTGLKAQQPAESTAIFPVFCHETSCRTSYVAERTGLPAIHSVVLDSQSL
jgi:predicted metalloprotease with PDZ domain